MQKKHALLPGILLLFMVSSCTPGAPDNQAGPADPEPEVIGVSVWDRISTKGQPVRNSPTITLLSLGEQFVYLDTSAIDSSYNNTKFLKARLSDSSEVWIYGFASVLNAAPAVIINDVPLYRRPDLMTITEEGLKAMEIVAVVEEWDDWVKVVNEKKAMQGWIHGEHITYSTIDIAFALLVSRALKEENPEQRIANLESLLEKNPYPNTIFTGELSNRVEEEKELLRKSRNEWVREGQDRRERDRR
jgi:hypothetical protein